MQETASVLGTQDAALIRETRDFVSYRCVESPIGRLLIAADSSGLREIRFLRNGRPSIPENWVEADGSGEAARTVMLTVTQLREYFEGARRDFQIPLAPRGTGFQQSVWRALQAIPYGQLTSYGVIAHRIGLPQSSRAVGAANGANPIPIVIPCHRVIGSSGALTGYGGGLDIKEKLLRLEGIEVEGDPGSPRSRVASAQVRLPL